MVCDRIYVLAYIPLFVLIAVAFGFIMIYEFKSIWTHGDVTFEPEQYLYHEVKGAWPNILSILWVIQAIWGLTFIKESFNFCVSGTAVGWYYNDNDIGCFTPINWLFTKHFGSVVGGSFMTGFFSIGDYLFDFIKPDEKENPEGAYTTCFNSVCDICIRIFDLVRSDAMSYIFLTGNPYCNSSRYCEYLCDQSLLTESSQSTSRSYRICAHFLIAGGVAIAGLFMKGSGLSTYTIIAIIVLAIFIATFFVSIHADAAEAIQIIFLEDEEFTKRESEETYKKFNRDDLDQGLKTSKRQDLCERFKEIRLQEKQKEWEKQRLREEKAEAARRAAESQAQENP